MIFYFWYSLKYNPAIRHTNETIGKGSWFEPKDKTKKTIHWFSFEKLGLQPWKKSKDLAGSEVGIQLELPPPQYDNCGCRHKVSSLVDKNIANPTDFWMELPNHTALVRFKLLEISIYTGLEPGLCQSQLQ